MRKNIGWANRLGCAGLVTGVLVTALSGPVLADPPGRYYDRGDWRDYRDDRRDRDQRRDNRDEHQDRDRDQQREHRDDRRDDRRERDADRERRDDRRDRDADRERRDDRHERDVQRDRDTYRHRDYGGDRNYGPPGYRQPGYDPMPWEKLYPRENRFRDRFNDRHHSQVIIRHGKRHDVPPDRVRWYRDVVVVRPFGHWYPGYAHHHRDDDAYKWLAFTAITLGLLDYLNETQQREHEAAQIAATTAPVGERIYWREGGAGGYVVATREGTSASGRYCREFQHQVTIGGRAEDAYGTACLNPDGSWEVVSAEGY